MVAPNTENELPEPKIFFVIESKNAKWLVRVTYYNPLQSLKGLLKLNFNLLIILHLKIF